MHMDDYIKQLDLILPSTGEKTLAGAGSVSHDDAVRKATEEYRKYQVKTLSSVEKEHLETLKVLSNQIENKVKNQ